MKVEVERTQTGIPGFDALCNGGIPKGSLIVLSGDPGSGKTIFCLQFLHNGVVDFNEPGVYISLEETKEEILNTGSVFGWDFRKLIQDHKIEVNTIELYDFEKLRDAIEDTVARIDAKRVVIDPGVIFRLYFERELDARKRILGLGKMLKRIGATSVITNEISLNKESSLYGLEEYVADGVILLYHTKVDDRFVRSTAILKMRNTKIAERLHPIEITPNGILVASNKDLFEQV
ncbi:MAG TPA: AAA family ATPase [Candidatus Diapherotrites archaeon]|uniref:AAA family ATPase n=1 Tax=Candidatus Iainarchaeum sp. TaxID=3101447 RepID=A0A7J4JEQ8_9ARCH|nr:AAA family ATPase [Candidatus Diapherotrites archaeon]